MLLKLDKRLSRLAETTGCEYSRYADDITFSGEKSIKSLFPLIIRIITEEGFKVNSQKTRFQYSNRRQEVTGLIVNQRLSVSRRLKNELRNAIYFSKKYGVDDHMKHIGCDKSFYKEHLYGIAYFIKMVEPSEGEKYLRSLDEINWD